MNLKEANTEKLIINTAASLEKLPEMKAPDWTHFVKTGVSRERPPTQKNWWFIRSASILRKIYLNPGIGVNRLRRVYGGRKNLGHRPEHFHQASGAVIRRSVQQLEVAGFIKAEKNDKGKISKRTVTEKGRELLENSAK